MVGLDSAVPAEVGGRVGVGAAQCGIPTAGDAVVARVLPIQIPAIDGAGSGIGNFYRGGKSIIPLAGDQILASGVSLCGECGYRQRKPCRIECAC